MVPKFYNLLWFDLQTFNFDNITLKITIFLQFNPYYKTTIKFLIGNTHKEYETIFERVFEGNSTEKNSI